MAHIDDPKTQKANMDYIREAMDQPLLEKEHELDLARKWRDDKDERALHELISSYTRLVVSVASKFKNYGLPFGDLIQEGNIGLMEAASRFEPSRELRFSTYATWWIRSAIQDYVLRNWSIVRTGTTAAQKSLFFNLRRLRAQIEGRSEDDTDYMSEATKERIAKELDVRKQDVDQMEGRIFASDHSLNAPMSGEDGTSEWQSSLSDERPNPEDIVLGMKNAKTRSKWLKDALLDLSDRERKIILDRRLTEDGVTLETLGNELGVSKERVRQLEQRAMDKLKASLLQKTVNYNDLFLEQG
ncbi:MAG: RNA polymerase factor sigma-32 [Rickettsiales bacterium]|nr:RNA polymerase factor sigma-32 [Rickettsiales bacterium]